MNTGSLVLILGGVVVVTFVRRWAYEARPRDPKASPADAQEFRRRMLLYYVALLLFVGVWVGQRYLLQRAGE